MINETGKIKKRSSRRPCEKRENRFDPGAIQAILPD